MPKTFTATELAAELRSDADNIAHSNRDFYPVGSLLDAATEIDRLRGLVIHYADMGGVPAEEAIRVCKL